jgi:hypothetical protein
MLAIPLTRDQFDGAHQVVRQYGCYKRCFNTEFGRALERIPVQSNLRALDHVSDTGLRFTGR